MWQLSGRGEALAEGKRIRGRKKGNMRKREESETTTQPST
jgi:hypothetical protein